MKKQTPTPPVGFKDPRALAGLAPDTPLCVALSGGADSVALLSMLADSAPVCAVHVHHGIRGAEADRDAEFCRQLTQELEIPFTLLHIDAPALARETGVSLETAAREGRYAAITDYMKKAGIPLLVTAHHANDQLETMLQHLLRGSGLAGLCGIPACRPLGEGLLVARPLLTVTKDALRAYLAEQGLDFVEDSTNAEGCCTRNRLRLEVLPVLGSLYDGGVKNAARCAALLAEDEAYLTSLAKDFLAEQGREPSLAALCALPRPIFARVVQALLPTSSEQTHIDALHAFCETAASGAMLSLPRAAVIAKNGKLIVDEPHPTADYEIVLQRGENPLDAVGGVAILCSKGEICNLPSEGRHKYATRISLASAMIQGDLVLRCRRNGDRILHEGMHKAVRKLAADLPAPLRARMPLLADEGGILAVPFAEPHKKGGALLRDGAFGAETDLWLYLYFN